MTEQLALFFICIHGFSMWQHSQQGKGPVKSLLCLYGQKAGSLLNIWHFFYVLHDMQKMKTCGGFQLRLSVSRNITHDKSALCWTGHWSTSTVGPRNYI